MQNSRKVFMGSNVAKNVFYRFLEEPKTLSKSLRIKIRFMEQKKHWLECVHVLTPFRSKSQTVSASSFKVFLKSGQLWWRDFTLQMTINLSCFFINRMTECISFLSYSYGSFALANPSAFHCTFYRMLNAVRSVEIAGRFLCFAGRPTSSFLMHCARSQG